MNMIEEWIKAAYLDVESMRYIVSVEHLTSITAFHAQQSIEKSFKALVENKYSKVNKQHDLLKLYSLISDSFTVQNSDMLDTLNQLYIDSRYPGSFGLLPYGKPTLKDAKEFYEFAKDIFEQVCMFLNISIDEIKAQ
ncbi:MAG: HEPN domain-containing protein [Campylobacterales bacterium]|nr:HEPN domain-containing protein [Campylobacterales bacterium]